MKIKAGAGVVGTGGISSYSCGSDCSDSTKLLLYNTEKKRIDKRL
jgi:hypothetical protein